MADLIIDLGNTRAKVARYQGGALQRALVVERPDPHALVPLFPDLPPERIGIGASGPLDPALLGALEAWAPVVLLNGASAAPLVNTYGTPTTLGVDRLANAVAARNMFAGRPVLAVDAGTCITYDLVDAEGRYLGGAISPGLAMRVRAMHAYSARLPLVELPAEPPRLGTTTAEALQSGVVFGALGELEGYLRVWRQQYVDLVVVLTGGDGLRMVRGLKNGIFAHPTLTLDGLHALLEHAFARTADNGA